MKKLFDRLGIITTAVIATALLLLLKTAGSHQSTAPMLADAGLPKSVLHYPDCNDGHAGGNCAQPETTPCYAGAKYQEYLDRLKQEKNIALFASAAMDDGRQLQIYRAADGSFITMAVGTDKTHMLEACQIAGGKMFQLSGSTPVAGIAPAPAR